MASISVTMPPGLAIELDEDRLGLVGNGALERGVVVGVGPLHAPAEILERVGELVDRAAIELGGSDQLVARRHHRVQRDHLRSMAGGERQPGGAAFQRGDAFLQHGAGRVADAGIDVAEGLQPEQRGGMVDVVEDVRCGLVDRRDARAGRRVGLGAGVNRQRGKARNAVGVGHCIHPCWHVAAVWPGSSAGDLTGRVGRPSRRHDGRPARSQLRVRATGQLWQFISTGAGGSTVVFFAVFRAQRHALDAAAEILRALR